MTRDYSREAEPHRVLELHRSDPQRGDDVKALQAAARRRLEARGISRDFEVDGVFGEQTAAALDSAVWALGALQSTVNASELSVGAQRMVRYPGRRSDAQLVRARQRMDDLERDRVQRAKTRRAREGERSAAGVAERDRAEVRRLALEAFDLLYRHAGAVHYTQGPLRWQGIDRGLRAADGRFPNYADCSAAYTWCVWNALTHVLGSAAHDVVNGQEWHAGYTGTLLAHGDPVGFDELRPGDAIIYGRGWPGVHVVMYDHDGLCYSHGSEAGPFHLSYQYRGDILAARRYF